jgi:hypothetical protein
LHDQNQVSSFNSFVASATLRIEEVKKLLECLRIRRVPKECALPPHLDQFLVLEFVEMMGKG